MRANKSAIRRRAAARRFEPVPFDVPSINGWARRYSIANQWRVRRIGMDADDLMQEGRIVFERVRRRYKTKNEKHLAALFRTSFVRHVNSLSVDNRREVVADNPEDMTVYERRAGNTQTFADACMDAPTPIRAILAAFAAGASIRCESTQRQRIKSLNAWLCQVAGCDPVKTDMAQIVMDWLKKYAPEMDLPYVV